MLTIVSDLLLTDCFLIKGNVENKYARLSQVLDEHRRYFLRVRDATLIDLKSLDRIRTPLVHVNLDEVLFGHEYIDEAGDEHRRLMSTQPELHRVRMFYTGNLNVELSGYVRPGAYEADDHVSRRFLVMRKPSVRGFDHRGDQELKGLLSLPYLIVNKLRLSYVYDFN
jgi:hypothetical protein